MNTIQQAPAMHFAGKWAIIGKQPEKMQRIEDAVNADADANGYEVEVVKSKVGIVFPTPEGPQRMKLEVRGFLTGADADEYRRTVKPQVEAYEAMGPLVEQRLHALGTEVQKAAEPFLEQLKAFWDKFNDGHQPKEADVEELATAEGQLVELQEQANERAQRLQGISPPPAYQELVQGFGQSPIMDLEALEGQIARGEFDPELGERIGGANEEN